mgnify:CR=1 FL=1
MLAAIANFLIIDVPEVVVNTVDVPEVVVNTTAAIAVPTAKPFTDGNPIKTVGEQFETEVDICEVTDIRGFRTSHPVTGESRQHNGVDIACYAGLHPVYVPFDGTLEILQPSQSGGGGLVARLRSGKYTVQIMHMDAIALPSGTVKEGDRLGLGGAVNQPNAGTSTGSHSHIEIFEGDRIYHDPTDELIKRLLGIK